MNNGGIFSNLLHFVLECEVDLDPKRINCATIFALFLCHRINAMIRSEDFGAVNPNPSAKWSDFIVGVLVNQGNGISSCLGNQFLYGSLGWGINFGGSFYLHHLRDGSPVEGKNDGKKPKEA